VTASPGERGELPRVLSGFDVATIMVAVTIGAGIFSAPHLIAGHLGDLRIVLLCWIGGAVFALVGCLVYAEVGARIPETGGEVVYLERAFGRPVGLVFVWIEFFLVAPSARVGLGLVAATYLLPGGSAGHHALIAAALIVALCAVNYVGIHSSLIVQRALVVAKVVGLLVLILGAWAWTEPAAAATAGAAGTSDWRAIASAMFLVLLCYSGWNRVASIVGEVRDPARALPFGLVAGAVVVTVFYLAVVGSYYRVLGAGGVAASPGVAAAAAGALGALGAPLISALVVVSAAGSMTGSILSNSRVSFAAARRGLFFPALGVLHPRWVTPSRAVAAHLLACLAFLAVRQNLEMVFASLVFGRLLFTGMVGAALFRLRRVVPSGGFQVPLFPLLPALFVAANAALVLLRLLVQPRESLIDVAILTAALPLVPLTRRLAVRGGSR
jgi:APA family basic amino acid/polyamine antiporter